MSETSARLPEWVTQADGRRVPFETDAICQALFATTEDAGRPDAFLARELADAVVHFLAQEDDEAPRTAHIAELVVKVVRELGQPALAHAFAERRQRRQGTATPEQSRDDFAPTDGPEDVAQRCLREYALQAVFSPDLAAAVSDGLLLLGGLETPAALAAAVVEGPAASRDLPGLLGDLHETLRAAGQCLILDSPEWLAAAYQGQISAEWLCRSLLEASRLLRRPTIVNVGCGLPPAWALACTAGPLFSAVNDGAEARHAEEFRALLLALWSLHPAPDLRRLDWHVRDAELTDAPVRAAVDLALQGEAVAFVFDRPRRPIALAEGADRKFSAVLQEVGLNLVAFCAGRGIEGDGVRFLEKLSSLARMAVSAGAQKRKFLRRHAEAAGLARGFLLDRARLAVVPLGLDGVVRALTGQGAASSPLALECACRIVEVLNASLLAAGRAAHLETGLDSAGPGLARLPGGAETRDGLDVADAAQPPLKQLQAAGRLHAITRRGTAWVRFTAGSAPTAEDLLELLRFAAKRTDIVRLRFLREPAALPDV